MPDKDTLNPGEFAIQDGATFSFDPTGTTVKFTKVDPTTAMIAITLNYKLDKPAMLQTTEGATTEEPITLPDTCGVFSGDNTSEHFRISATPSKKLALAAPQNSSQVFIGSGGGDFKLLTDGEKGRQGDTFANLAKDETREDSKK